MTDNNLANALRDINDTLRKNNIDFSGLAMEYSAVYEVGKSIQRGRIALETYNKANEPVQETSQVASIESDARAHWGCYGTASGRPLMVHTPPAFVNDPLRDYCAVCKWGEDYGSQSTHNHPKNVLRVTMELLRELWIGLKITLVITVRIRARGTTSPECCLQKVWAGR